MYNKLTDTELKTLLNNINIAVDSREQENKHILSYFEDKRRNIPYVVKKLNSGDYSCYITSNADTEKIIGNRDLWFDNKIAIERKNSIDELASSIKDRDRFTNEFDRAKANGTKVLIFTEDENGLNTIINHKYRSEYNPKALYASLKTFESRYGFQTKFVSKELIGMEIYWSLYYHVRELLKVI